MTADTDSAIQYINNYINQQKHQQLVDTSGNTTVAERALLELLTQCDSELKSKLDEIEVNCTKLTASIPNHIFQINRQIINEVNSIKDKLIRISQHNSTTTQRH